MGFSPAIGQSDFRKLRRGKSDLIDKSSFVTDLVTDRTQVLLFPRPRRFGKTTNLSMLRYFFEISPEDRSDLFSDLQVWQSAEARAHFQKHPVIWLSFFVMEHRTWEVTLAHIKVTLRDLFSEHRALLQSAVLSGHEKERFQGMLNGTANDSEYTCALLNLSRWLALHHGHRTLILIDDFDLPISAASDHGYFTPLMQFMGALLESGLKDNPHVYKGVLVCLARAYEETRYSDMTNAIEYSMKDVRFSAAFGFTEAEVSDLCDRIGCPEMLEDLRQLYGGYVIASRSENPTTLFNPNSVLTWATDPRHLLEPRWIETLSHDNIEQLLRAHVNSLARQLEQLMSGAQIECPFSECVKVTELARDVDAFWSYLWHAGYLSMTRLRVTETGQQLASMRIPNREVRIAFDQIFRSWYRRGFSWEPSCKQLITALFTGDEEGIEDLLTEWFNRNMPLFDPGSRQPEKRMAAPLYHGLILGLLVHLEGKYEVRSNPESGHGRADLLIRPLKAGQPGAVLELKVLRRSETIATALKKALDQVEARAYATQLEAAGASPIHTYAMLFDGKQAYVVTPATWQQRFGVTQP